MKKIFLFYLAIIITTIANAQSAKFIAADSAYNTDDYTGAIRLYEDVIATEGTSSAIFYNLGNAYYRIGKNGKALVNYERALRLSPNDADIKANIEFVNSRLQDKRNDDTNVFANVFDRIVSHMSSNTWAWLSLTAFVILIGGLLLYFFADSIILRKVGFFSAIVLFIVSLLLGIFAVKAKSTATSKSYAIITSPSAIMSTSPREPKNKHEEAMTLHEGYKIELIDSVKVTTDSITTIWYNAKTDADNRAWIKSADIEII